MSTIQIRVEERLKNDAYAVFKELNVNPSEALRQMLMYVAENKKLPFTSMIISETDNDDDIIAIAKMRLENPSNIIKVNMDEI